MYSRLVCNALMSSEWNTFVRFSTIKHLPLCRVSVSNSRLWILEQVWVWKTAFLLLIRLNLLLKVIISFRNFSLSSQNSLFSLSWILKQWKDYYADYKKSTKALLTLQHVHCFRWRIMHGSEIFSGQWCLSLSVHMMVTSFI